MDDAVILALTKNEPNNLTSNFRLFRDKTTGIIYRYPDSYIAVFDNLEYYSLTGVTGYGLGPYGATPYGL